MVKSWYNVVQQLAWPMAPANITSITHLLENCALLCNYAAGGGNFLPTFQDTLLVPSSGVKMGPLGSPETSVRNYRYSLLNNPEQHSWYLLRG